MPISSAKDELVGKLEALFEGNKDKFLADVKLSIRSVIADAGITKCLTVVEKFSYKDDSWTPGYLRYPLVLIQFMRGDTYSGHNLDSALTPLVVDVVTKQFDNLYELQDEAIGRSVMEYLIADEVMAKQFFDAALGTSMGKVANSQIQAQVHALILDQVRQLLHSGTGQSMLNSIGHKTGALAKPIAAIIVKLVLINMKVVVAKVLVSAAAKAAVAVAVKKLLIAAVSAAIAKAILVKLGAAALTGPLILVAIGVLITYEAATFPGHLGDKVGTQVAADLGGQYTSINRDILENLAIQVLSTGWREIAKELAQNPDVQHGVSDLIQNLISDG